MKIILLILLSTCLSLANSEYPRFMRRGPQQNGPPRPPPPPQFGKKWGKLPQKTPPHFMQNRPYPAPPQQVRGGRPKPPMHPIQGAHIPINNIGQVQHTLNGPKFQKYPYQPKPQLSPMKVFFKNPVQQHKIPNAQAVPGGLIQFPQESNKIPSILPKQEKVSFVSSPSIPSALEYDYHIQTNSIPINTNPIKQVGEKGPIHTIPAPNLTPADKPSNLELRKQHHYHQQQEVRFQQPQYNINDHQSINQYQVTEPSEQAPKQVFREQINPQTHYGQNLEIQSYQNGPSNQPTNQYLDQIIHQQLEQQNGAQAQAYQNIHSVFYNQDNPGLTLQENENHGINIAFEQPKNDHGGQEDMVFSNTKHFQVVNGHFPNGEATQNHQTQAIQSSYVQQQPQVSTQFLKEPGYLQRFQQDIQLADDKSLNVQPEYHSFNYDEQAHQAQAKSGQASYVTAAYSLGSSDEIVKGQNINSRSSSTDPLTQAQIVQSYFESRSENTLEPDAKPSASQNNNQENLNSAYYISLPSKETADRLAKLQAAGKINSSLMKLSNSNRNHNENPNELPTIYVPDENNSPDEKQDRIDQDSKEQSLEYDDYQDEEDDTQSEEESSFGHKIKSRKQ